MISPSERIVLIHKSQRIFVCGILALLPVVGFIPAIYAIGSAVRISRRFKGEWNPAANYLRLGVVLAVLCFGIFALAGLILVLRLMPPFGENGY